MLSKDRLLSDARDTLKKIGKVPAIPLDRLTWPEYLCNLRKNLLGMVQTEFWAMFDVKSGTGSKYEQPYQPNEDNNTARLPKKELMLRVSSELNLQWEMSTTYFKYASEQEDSLTLTPQGVAALKLMSQYDITIEDLRVMIDLKKSLNKNHK